MTDILTAADVSVRFGGLQALSHVSVAVLQGSIVGLIGPNGAGKTTLFNVVSGLQRPDTGTVVFGGVDVTEFSPHRRAALGMARSFQNLGIITEETVQTNLMAAQHLSAGYFGWDTVLRPWRWFAQERHLRARAVEVAGRMGLAARLDTRVADLSFDAARLVELAAVVVDHPRLLLLDEPTTGLDLAEVVQLQDILRAERAEGTTILVVAHDVRFVMNLCDYVYVLASGTVLAQGTPALVQRDPAVIEAYLGKSA